jgi:hypothetical protein
MMPMFESLRTAPIALLQRTDRSSVAQPPPPPTYGRSDANGFAALGPTPTLPTYTTVGCCAPRHTTLTTFVAVSVRKIYLHPATVMAALQLL